LSVDTDDFRRLALRPALVHLGLWSRAAEDLLLGTALAESGGLRWLAQRGGGPALGFFQIEPATHDDVWRNYLAYRSELAAKTAALAAPSPDRTVQLATNLRYAAAIARLIYRRVAAPLPITLAARAGYWKAHYNTAAGAGATEHFIAAWRAAFPQGD